MLTIREPITLTAQPSIVTVSDHFAERMTANYKVMTGRINEEDMLHFISVPPEIYLAEGNEGSFVNLKNTNNIQNTNIELINNVINRILVSDTYHMTYQDKVFVTSVLKKLGVTDVSEFISQVKLLREETKNIHELINLYHSDGDVLHELKQYHTAHTDMREKETVEKTQTGNAELWLHQEILNRLHTANTYQQVKQYISDSWSNHRVINSMEMQLSEQTLAAQNMILNNLKNYAVSNEQPLLYNQVNTYELGDINEIEEDRHSMIRQLVQAVLVNTINQMYVMRIDELTKNKNVWYQLAGAIHETTQNTLRRFESFHNTLQVSREENNAYHTTLQQYQKNEIEVLKQLSAQQTMVTEKNSTFVEVTEAEPLLHKEESVSESENGAIPSQTGQEKAEPASQIINEIKQDNRHIQNLTKEELLKQQLEIINQQNIERLKKLQQININPTKSQKHIINREKMREDAMRAITNPQEVIEEYMNSETTVTNQELINHRELSQVFDEQTLQIFEQIREQQEQPKSEYQRLIESEAARSMLMRDLVEQERIERESVRQENIDMGQETLVHNTQNVTHVSENEISEYSPIQKETLEIHQERNRQRTEHRFETLESKVFEKLSVINRDVRTQTGTIAEKMTDRYLTRTISLPKQIERQKLQQDTKDLMTLVQKSDTDVRNTVMEELLTTDVGHRKVIFNQVQDVLKQEVQEQRDELRSTEQSVTQNLIEKTITDERNRTIREHDYIQEQELVHDLREMTVVSENEPHRMHQSPEREPAKSEIEQFTPSGQKLSDREIARELTKTVREQHTIQEQELIHDFTERTQVSESELQVAYVSQTVLSEPEITETELIYKESGDVPGSGKSEEREILQSTQQTVLREVIENLTDRQAQQTLKREREMITETLIHDVEKQVERVSGTAQRIINVRQQDIRNITEAELTHRSNETLLDEEMIEELRKIGRNTRVEVEETKEHVNETRNIHEVVTNKVNEIELRKNEEIERLISQNVRQQLGQLSEQVYGKLEKRMDAERRRRGL
ncbi:MAG: hypothetical protein II247_00655 [Lachnospiraceae bacterium]|nr:hypothetical protein [Lachnospiraceae bacterium]